MQVLVTGGAGFVGSHLCKRLLDEGHDVVAIDNLSNGTEYNIECLQSDSHFEFIKIDINDTDELRAVFETHPFEMVFHLAANADVYKGLDDSNLDVKNTFLTTLNILEMMHSYGVKKFFFASSSTVYGRSEEPIREVSPSLRPVSHYGAAKLASEAFVSSYNNLYGIQTWVARFCNVVGPNMTHGVILDFIKKLKSNPEELIVYGDGRQTKPYIYIDDLLDGVMCMLRNAGESYNDYLIGVESYISVAEIARIAMMESGLNVPISYEHDVVRGRGDVRDYHYDVNKLKTLGWHPHFSAKEAVMQTMRDINENVNN